MRTVLAVNAGSSSLKLGLFDTGGARLWTGEVSRIGQAESRLVIRGADGRARLERTHAVADHDAAWRLAIEHLEAPHEVGAVGHRVVRGGVQHVRPTPITQQLLDALHADAWLDPQHQAPALALIELARGTFSRVPHVACFDSAFHRTMPRVAQLYGLPRNLIATGVIRMGFHGLSCEHVMHALAAVDPPAAGGRVIVAHLGSGASVTAIRDGVSIDNSMGFTPTGGLVMGSRSGDLDPMVLLYLLERKRLDGAGMRELLNQQSGLRGVSGLTADMRELLEREATNPDAAEAVALFCYVAQKFIGAMAAALGGLDTLVFTGGIAERAAAIRERICVTLAFIGVALDADRNARHDPVISTSQARVTVRVVPADEESTIARHVNAALHDDGGSDVPV